MNQITITLEDDEMYEHLLRYAKAKRMTPEELVLEQVIDMMECDYVFSMSQGEVDAKSARMVAKRRGEPQQRKNAPPLRT